jgi:hypothetical protein
MNTRPDTREMETLYNELMETLGNIAGQLDELYGSMQCQQRAVVNRDLMGLHESIREQSRLARSVRDLEERRIEISRRMTGLNDPPSVSRIAEGFREPRRNQLKDASRRIRESAGRAEALKRQNAYLLEKARSLVNSQLKLFMEMARVNRNVYEESGKKSRQTNLHKVFDRKI